MVLVTLQTPNTDQCTTLALDCASTEQTCAQLLAQIRTQLDKPDLNLVTKLGKRLAELDETLVSELFGGLVGNDDEIVLEQVLFEFDCFGKN